MVDPAGPAKSTHPPPGAPQSAGMPAPPPASDFPNLGKIIAISLGKGGVGKSTVSANLATANNGTQIGSPAPITGQVGGALRFNGTSSYVESPSSIVTNIGPADGPP